jgi:hypothetical protein
VAAAVKWLNRAQAEPRDCGRCGTTTRSWYAATVPIARAELRGTVHLVVCSTCVGSAAALDALLALLADLLGHVPGARD